MKVGDSWQSVLQKGRQYCSPEILTRIWQTNCILPRSFNSRFAWLLGIKSEKMCLGCPFSSFCKHNHIFFYLLVRIIYFEHLFFHGLLFQHRRCYQPVVHVHYEVFILLACMHLMSICLYFIPESLSRYSSILSALDDSLVCFVYTTLFVWSIIYLTSWRWQAYLISNNFYIVWSWAFLWLS